MSISYLGEEKGMGRNKETQKGHVSLGQILAWNTRPISLGAVTIIIGYLSLFCTDYLKMPAVLVGTLLLASKIVDGITDLVAGWLVDNTHTRLGKGRPYELSLIGVWICMWALFGGSASWSLSIKCVWIFIMYTLVFSVFSTLLNAAETPYIIRAFKDPLAVAKVSAYGGIFVTIGCLVVSISFPMIIAGLTDVTGWRKAMAMYAVPLVLIGLIRFIFVKEKQDDVDEKKDEKVSIKEMLDVIFHNKYVWFFAVATALPQMITAMAAGSYYFKWIYGNVGTYGSIQGIGMLALIIMFIFPTLMKKYSPMQLVGGCAVLGIVGYLLNFVAGTNYPLLAIGFLLSGIASLPAAYMRSPIVMQISDYNESVGKARLEGTMGSVSNFVHKIASGIGSFLVGAMLSAGGYQGDMAIQSDKALMMIRLLYSIVPAILMVATILCSVGFHPLDKMNLNSKTE